LYGFFDKRQEQWYTLYNAVGGKQFDKYQKEATPLMIMNHPMVKPLLFE
jgi:hypothetical protein